MPQQLDLSSPLNANLVNSVVTATVDVLNTMAFTKVEFKEVQAEADYKPSGDISAVIGIFGANGEEGMMALSFSMGLSKLIVSRLLGTHVDKLSSEDLFDGVRELVNMISGGAKAALSQSSNTLYRISLPTVILGKDHQISNRPSNTPYLLLRFETEGESFNMQVSLQGPSG